jgi:signal peptidase I
MPWPTPTDRRRRRTALKRATRLCGDVPLLLYQYRKRIAIDQQWVLSDRVRALNASTAKAREAELTSEELSALETLCTELESSLNEALPATIFDTLRDYAETLIIALLIALFIKAFLFEAFKIPSGSMIPTLQVDDRIFVSKFVYGIRIPGTELRLFDWRKPQRGEVIVFEYPGPGPDNGVDFIKRVLAIEGDRLRLDNNVWVINGEVSPNTRVVSRTAACQLPPGEVCHAFPDRTGSQILLGQSARDARLPYCPCTFMEEGSAAYDWHTQHVSPGFECQCESQDQFQSTGQNQPDWPTGASRSYLAGWGTEPNPERWMKRTASGRMEMKVPPGYVFVVGDNRDDSKDGRYWGLVPLENIRGKASLIWWAGEHFWDRILRQIH